MNKKLLAALVAAVSFQAVGAENVDAQQAERSYLNDGWYLGVDIIDTDVNATNWDGASSAGEVSSTSAALAIGYNFHIADSFVVGLEAEYAHYGSFDIALKGDTAVNNLEFSAFNLNVKPQYYFGHSGFYLGGIFGIGGVGGENKSNGSEASGSSVLYGVEAGYAFNNNWSINAGYRTTTAEYDNADFDMDTLFLGLDYKF
ncbi:outer membrane beta-barrel protein [Vibrio neptunius]|uniref:Porin family protein n=1 Tax=Vibrio neptunius TaxID=170651 RepID=A0ABS3A3A0_9VIBR|nr:outer membrane beta-barrel protein [Vibrio neptunius]MBN3493974.1 porin family protein [Vibrio neptunius]MBN3516470.1 porin family protein [Vibrio neptunius]MBN3550558.1 porin family protein [Vibrio neptunius]MBN3578689.1 porin family protein [Vibrio neptunius]MCH9872354.1 porin family protein [Vibrio neptunius]